MSKTTIAARFLFARIPPSLIDVTPPYNLTQLLRKPLSTMVAAKGTLIDRRLTIFSNNTTPLLSPPLSSNSPFLHTRLKYSAMRIISTPSTTSVSADSTYPFLNSAGGQPIMVSSILEEMDCECPRRNCDACTCDDHHWLVIMFTNGLHYETDQACYNDYVKALAPVVGSEEEAKQKIYLVSCGHVYGFGVELERELVSKLNSSYGVQTICRDVNYWRRKQNPTVQSSKRFTPMNKNHRLENIFSYYHLSEKNKEWKDDHWLIAIKQPAAGFKKYDQIFDCVVQLLTKVVGSKEEAIKRIYAIWYTLPFGFGAEIDKEASEKLREMKNVLEVLPDCAFDVKDDSYGVRRVIEIRPASGCRKNLPSIYGSRCNYNRQIGRYYPEKGHADLGSSGSGNEMSDCKHWFITMKKPVGGVTLQQQLDVSIETTANVCNSVKEEAKEKIYRFECGDDSFGFGAELDAETSKKLGGALGVVDVLPDKLINKFPRDDILFGKVLNELTLDMRRWALESTPQ